MSILLYEPKLLVELLHSGEGVARVSNIYAFNIAIVCAICLGTMLLGRLLFLFAKKWLSFTVPYYAFWCVGEVLVMSAFVALYITLIGGMQQPYFNYLGLCFRSLITILVYPYVIIAQIYYASNLPKQFIHDEGMRLKFYDNRHLLKFSTTASSILYIQANENYLNICYVENDKVKEYELRNSMKSVEELCQKAGFVRAHRSYIVNPSQVKMVAKADMGRYVAKFSVPDSPEIPVSKRNYESLVALL